MASTSHVVVVGHGMVGHRFVEAPRSRDAGGAWRVTVLAEELDAAYDRVGLTGYTEHWDRARLALPGNDYVDDPLVDVRLGSRVTGLDPTNKSVATVDGARIDYDALVLATDSYAFVPPVPGHDLPHCQVYRRLKIAERGGVLTDLTCVTSDSSIYAIGEVAAIEGRCYGLVGPGYTSAEVVADRLLGGEA